MGVTRASARGTDALIVFDGECVLCEGLFHWVLRRDTGEYFQFATVQSPLGQAVFAQLGLRPDTPETMIVQIAGKTYCRLDGVAAIARQLPFPWPTLSLFRHLPRWIKDPVYNLVARNRYRLFGRKARCLVPSPDLQRRFAPNGFGRQAQN